MIKREIISEVSQRTGLKRDEVCLMLDTLINVFNDAVSRDESIYIRGLFTFKTVKRKAKKGQNISKGTVVDIPEKMAPKFIASKRLLSNIKQTK